MKLEKENLKILLCFYIRLKYKKIFLHNIVQFEMCSLFITTVILRQFLLLVLLIYLFFFCFDVGGRTYDFTSYLLKLFY